MPVLQTGVQAVGSAPSVVAQTPEQRQAMVSLFGPGYAGPAKAIPPLRLSDAPPLSAPMKQGHGSGAGDWGCVPRSCGTVADTAHADRARLAGGGRCEGQGAYDVGYQLGEGKGDASR